jgi:ubiquitin-activating enzyme E1
MGHEAQRRMMSSRAVLLGLSGLGVEIAKNIILAGISSVTLCDPVKPNSYDLGGNFYLTRGDLDTGKGRAELVRDKLAELNEYVKVEVANVGSLGDTSGLLNLVQGASVVVVTIPLPTSLLC